MTQNTEVTNESEDHPDLIAESNKDDISSAIMGMAAYSILIVPFLALTILGTVNAIFEIPNRSFIAYFLLFASIVAGVYVSKRIAFRSITKEPPALKLYGYGTVAVVAIIGMIWVTSETKTAKNNEVVADQKPIDTASIATVSSKDRYSTLPVATPVKTPSMPHYLVRLGSPLCPDLKSALRMSSIFEVGTASDQVLMSQWVLSGCEMADKDVEISLNATVNEVRGGVTSIRMDGVMTVYVPTLFVTRQ